MCGIVGISSRKHSREECGAIVDRMMGTQRHRGPDSELKKYLSENTVLGHTRLAILGLTSEGEQPMSSPSGRYCYVINGEIYNYIELFEKYKFPGAVPGCDSIIFGLLLDRLGIDQTLKELNGMYAIALFDHTNELMHLIRDRLGKKPLFYASDKNIMVFGSEIKSITAADVINLSVDYDSILDYLSLFYIPADNTAYNEIQQVPPASYITFSDGAIISCTKYWEIPEFGSSEVDIEELDELLKSAVSLRLRSDVQTGIFLSGGIDSGLLTALAAKMTTSKICTYTVSIGGGYFDEAGLAKMVADYYGTNHRVIQVNNDPLELFEEMSNAFDEPIGDPSAMVTYAVSKEASKYCKVVLNGEGGDELFSGYRRTVGAHILNLIDDNSIYRYSLKALNGVLTKRNVFNGRNINYYVERLNKSLMLNWNERYIGMSSDGLIPSEYGKFIKTEFSQSGRIKTVSLSKQAVGNDFLKWFTLVDIQRGMTDCLLKKIDRTTMANSIEGRSPFLDYRIVEKSMLYNRAELFSLLQTKLPLRNLAKKYLPSDIIRQPKRGFEPPYRNWLNNSLKRTSSDLIHSSNLLRELFKPNALSSIIDAKNEFSDRVRADKIKWALMMLAKWDVSR